MILASEGGGGREELLCMASVRGGGGGGGGEELHVLCGNVSCGDFISECALQSLYTIVCCPLFYCKY